MIPWIQTILGFWGFFSPFLAGMSLVGEAAPDDLQERKCGCTIPLLKLDLNWKWSFIMLSEKLLCSFRG